MTDEKTTDVNLHECTDAAVWAREFCKRFPMGLSEVEGREGAIGGGDWEGLMIGWFANAIMAGYDRADRAEAERAAQIEVEPVAWRWESCANSQGWNTRYGCEKPTPSDYITDIVPLYATQPHDRTALARMQALCWDTSE